MFYKNYMCVISMYVSGDLSDGIFLSIFLTIISYNLSLPISISRKYKWPPIKCGNAATRKLIVIYTINTVIFVKGNYYLIFVGVQGVYCFQVGGVIIFWGFDLNIGKNFSFGISVWGFKYFLWITELSTVGIVCGFTRYSLWRH